MISPVKVWRRQKTIRDLLGKKGKIVSWTKIYTPPPEFKHIAPYMIAYVLLDNKRTVCAQLVDAHNSSEISFGTRVKITLRKLRENVADGVIPYTIACKKI